MAYKAGDTAKLAVSFADFEGLAADPDTITLTISDRNRVVLQTIVKAALTRTAVGIYEYWYITPPEPQLLYYRFEGVKNGYPMVDSNPLPTEW